MGRQIDADKFKQQVAGMVISMHYPAKKAIEIVKGGGVDG